MSSRCRNLRRAAVAAAAVLVLMGNHQAGAAPPTARVCVDTTSPAASVNRKVAEAVAHEAGWTLQVVAKPWTQPGEDEGLGPKAFRAMAEHTCDLVMGYPVDAQTTVVPPGLNHTGAYIHTGFVLVGRGAVPAWSHLRRGTTVGVTYNTPAALLLAERGGVVPHVYDTEAETIAAVRAGKVPYALVWELSLDGRRGGNGGLTVRRLGLPQADWVLVALYADRAAGIGRGFDKALDRLRADGRLASLTEEAKPAAGPRLYTSAQADRGARLFADNCASCHGAQLQGNVGPTLRGQGFAAADDGFTVGTMFTFFSTQMPAGAPGSLKNDDYTALMAFLLRENGYPPGDRRLAYTAAKASTVPLISRVGAAGPAQAADGK